MFLCDHSIQERIDNQRITITPFDPRLLRPSSYILRLSDSFAEVVETVDIVDPTVPKTIEKNVMPPQVKSQYVITHQQAVLASTMEKLALPHDVLGIISGISHIARLNISVHCSSFLINPGFGKSHPSSLTLELYSYNPSPVRLYAGMPICHLILAQLDAEASQGYDDAVSVYTGQTDPVTSRYHVEFSKYIKKNQE